MHLLALVAAVLMPAGDALALWEDRLELFASHSLFHDDNVLRLPGGNDANADTYRVTSLGFNLDAPLGRQRLLGGLTLNDVRYDKFSAFDLDGHSGHAAWQWQLGDAFEGRLEYSQSLALASLSNVQDGVQSRTPNALTTRQALASAAYAITPRWQLQAEAARLEQSNEAAERQLNDLSVDSGEATLNYATPAGSRFGLRARVAQGLLPNPQFVSGLRIDNSYRQRELGVVAAWTLGGHSRLKARASRVRRGYEQLPQRDFDGPTYELAYDWTPTGKLALAAIAQHDISTTEEVNLSFVLATRIGLYPKYRLSDKIELSALLETSDREYLGEADQVLGAVPPRRERVRAAGIVAGYRPVPRITLRLSLRRETRSASVAGGGYAVDVFSLGGRIGF